MRHFFLVLAVLISAAACSRREVPAAARDNTPAEQAGQAAYKASREAGHMAKKAGKEIKEKAKEFGQGWKEASRDSKKK